MAAKVEIMLMLSYLYLDKNGYKSRTLNALDIM